MRKALGKGLEALFPATPAAPPPAGERLVPVQDIVPNPDQPRRHFDEEALAALADSIRRHGLLQPLVVCAAGDRYELIAGERRLLALPEPVKAQVETGELSAGHARAVLSVDPAEQASFAREIAVAGVSKREAESRAAARRPRPRPTPVPAAPPDLQIRAVAEELTRDFGTRVRIVRRGRGGATEIEFYSDAELDRPVHRLRAAAPSPAATR